MIASEEVMNATIITTFRAAFQGTAVEKAAAQFEQADIDAKVTEWRDKETADWNRWVTRVVNFQVALDDAERIRQNPDQDEPGNGVQNGLENNDRRMREQKEEAPKKKLGAPPSFNKPQAKGKGAKLIITGFVGAALKKRPREMYESEEEQPRKRHRGRRKHRRRKYDSDSSSSGRTDSDDDDYRSSRRKSRSLKELVHKEAPNDSLGAACVGFIELCINLTFTI